MGEASSSIFVERTEQEVAQPTNHLRFSKSGVLQQAWTITTERYDARKGRYVPVDQRPEWRDVPTEQQ